MKSVKAIFGLFLMLTVDLLQLWLTTSVLLSWVMKSKYFFPIPYIPIKPAALLASAAGTNHQNISSTPFANYGVNVGPMVVSAVFRFFNGRIETFMGNALSQAYKRQKKERKAVRKEEERKEAERLRQERKAARKARREERELRKQYYQEEQQKREAAQTVVTDEDNDQPTQSTATTNYATNEQSNKNNNNTEASNQDSILGGMEELD